MDIVTRSGIDLSAQAGFYVSAGVFKMICIPPSPHVIISVVSWSRRGRCKGAAGVFHSESHSWTEKMKSGRRAEEMEGREFKIVSKQAIP